MYYFKKVAQGIITTVEAKSVNIASPDFVEATKEEYDTFIASLPVVEKEPPPHFEPENSALGVEQRISHIEEFLEEVYPGGE